MAKDIHKKFGRRQLKTFSMCGMLTYKIYYRYFRGMHRVYPLDFVVYNKSEAEELLHEKYGWTKYEYKHYENVFTHFFEGYHLPHKYGFDTRKNVASNQILAGILTREETLKRLEFVYYGRLKTVLITTQSEKEIINTGIFK